MVRPGSAVPRHVDRAWRSRSSRRSRSRGRALRAALREDAALAQALYPRVLVAVARRLNATRVQLMDLFAAEEVHSW